MDTINSGNNPGEIYEILTGYWKTGILKAAIELDVFTEIAQENDTIRKMATVLQVKERGLIVLLDALCGMKLLDKKGDTYVLGLTAEKFLVSSEPSYVGQSVKCLVPPESWESYGQITKAIKKGAPLREDPPTVDYWERVADGLIPMGIPIAQAMCDLININDAVRPKLRILDLACGSGIYGYTILQRNSRATVTDLDLEHVLEYAKGIANKLGVTDRVTYQVGDILTSDYGEDLFEIAIISNILQGFDPDTVKTILAKVYRALSLGGTIVINEFVPDDERAVETFPLLFAVFMFLETQGGGTYTFSEFSNWLSELGFADVTLHNLSEPNSLIIGHKPNL